MRSKLVNKYMKDNINIIHVCIILFSSLLKIVNKQNNSFIFQKINNFLQKMMKTL